MILHTVIEHIADTTFNYEPEHSSPSIPCSLNIASQHPHNLQLSTYNRTTTKVFQACAEAYNISAVTVSSEGSEEGGNYVDFGLLRVGDIAIKKIGLGNKGKYRVSYKFVFTRPNLMKFLVLSPMEGVIEAGGKDVAQISMTFTSLEAIQLVSVKHVCVQLIEPATGELVETFPLCISAVSKYSTYRLQPSKGLSFGAVKFDAEPRVKRVELRNEGTYVHSTICT